MIRRIVFLIFAIAVFQCNGVDAQAKNNSPPGVGGHRVAQIKLNKWFDRTLPLIQKYMKKHAMDPMKLPAMNLPVPNIPGPKAKIELVNGMIHGSSNITRSGDIIQRIYDHSWQVDAQLKWQHLELNYNYALKYLLYKRKGALTASFFDLNVIMMGSVDFSTRKVELRHLKIVDAGDFLVKICGHLVDPIANAAIRALRIPFRKQMLREIEHQINIAVHLKIGEFNNWLANQTSIPLPNLTEIVTTKFLL